MSNDRSIDLVELYALDALVGDEMRDFERHQAQCLLCQLRLAEARSVTASLVPDSDPPGHVWNRIAAEIEDGSMVPSLRTRGARVWVGLTAVAAAVAVALGGVLLARMNDTADQAILALSSAAQSEPGTVVAELVADDVTVAKVVLAADGRGFFIAAEALIDLDPGRTYQLWVINEQGRVISGGVLGNSPRVSAFTWTDGVSGFALTREVAGGVEISEGDVVAVVTDL